MSEVEMTAPTTFTPVERPKIVAVLTDSAVLARRSLLRIPRQPDWLVGAIVQPIMFILLFRYIFGGTVQAALPGGIGAVDYLMSGIIVQGVVFGTISTALGLAEDIKQGLMDRFRSLPMTRISVILGRILADLVLNVIVFLASLAVAIAVGFRPDANVAEWLLAGALLLLLSFAFSWIGAFIGLSLKSVEAVSSVGLIWIFPLTFASSAFVPLATMPGWLQVFAKNQPFTLVVDSVRSLLIGYPDLGNKPLQAIIWLVAITIVAMMLALRAFERRVSS